MQIFEFKQGLEESIKRIKTIASKPKLVTVYGLPNSGKSHLINSLGSYFEGMGIETARCSGAPVRELFEKLRDEPEILRGILLFHYASERFLFNEKDPNHMAKSIVNKNIDLNILVFNPRDMQFSQDRLNPKVDGEYDIVISNPNSLIKPRIIY